MINQQLHNYKIISLLGEGGMASVYLAENTSLKIHVALKVLKDDYVRNSNIRNRFLAEARNLAKMQHLNVVKVTDLIDAGDIVLFAMEYIKGSNLDDFVNEKGILSDLMLENIFNQILDALSYVHNLDLIHRDIKPSNFMISELGIVKLLDFGIAKNNTENQMDYTKTGLLDQLGTPSYMSPEQIRNTSAVTEQSDIYSTGVLLWYLLKGKSPYFNYEGSIFDLQNKIVFDNLPLTGTQFDSIIQKATQKKQSNRYNSIDEFKLEFNKLINQVNKIGNKGIDVQSKKKISEYIFTFLIISFFILFAIFFFNNRAKKPVTENTIVLSKLEIQKYRCEDVSDIKKDMKVDFESDTVINSQCEGVNHIFVVEDFIVIDVYAEIITEKDELDEEKPTQQKKDSAPKKINDMSKKEISSLKIGAKVADEKGDFEVYGYKIAVEKNKVKSKEQIAKAPQNNLQIHTVVKGENLNSIVKKYSGNCPNLSVAKLIEHNLVSPKFKGNKEKLEKELIDLGWKLEIPCE